MVATPNVPTRSQLLSKAATCKTLSDKFWGGYLNVLYTEPGARGGAVVEALRYKPEGRGIDSRWCHWNFSLT
jgi:hypothetical protein